MVTEKVNELLSNEFLKLIRYFMKYKKPLREAYCVNNKTIQAFMHRDQ